MGPGDRGTLNAKVTGVYLESVGATEDAEQGTRWIGQWRARGHTPVTVARCVWTQGSGGPQYG